MSIKVRKQRCMAGLPWWTVIDARGRVEFTSWQSSFEDAIKVADELAAGGRPRATWLGFGVYPSPRQCASRLIEITEAARYGAVPVRFIGGMSA